jgi:hypothetical protein
VIDGMASVISLMPQLLEQLAGFLRAQADRSDLFDDRADVEEYPPAATATFAAGRLRVARTYAAPVAQALREAAAYVSHLGNDESTAERHRQMASTRQTHTDLAGEDLG